MSGINERGRATVEDSAALSGRIVVNGAPEEIQGAAVDDAATSDRTISTDRAIANDHGIRALMLFVTGREPLR